MNQSQALYAFESEAALIGAAMYAPEDCQEAFERLPPELIGDGAHALIWRAIREVHLSGGRPLPEIVRDRLGASPVFQEWGGFDLLWSLWDKATTRGVVDHVNAVADRAARRRILDLTKDISARIMDTASGDALALLAELEQGAADIARGTTTQEHWVSGADLVAGALDWAQARSDRVEHPIGIAAVDDLVGGLGAGESTLLGARPGAGKTVAAQTVARANCALGLGTCFFSLEMAAHPLGLRLACDLAYDRNALVYGGLGGNPTADAAMRKQLDANQWRRLQDAREIVRDWPIMFDTRAGLTMPQIEAAALRQHRRWERAGIPLGPVIIDHLGKVRPSKDRKGARHAEMADISAEAAAMAKRLGVPVLALVQLNRQVENREDKRPQLSDLRQAGELEEDARKVIFLYRPEYYLREGPDGESFEQEAERKSKLRAVERKLYWIVEKNSHGPKGQVLTYCDIGCSAIREWQP